MHRFRIPLALALLATFGGIARAQVDKTPNFAGTSFPNGAWVVDGTSPCGATLGNAFGRSNVAIMNICASDFSATNPAVNHQGKGIQTSVMGEIPPPSQKTTVDIFIADSLATNAFGSAGFCTKNVFMFPALEDTTFASRDELCFDNSSGVGVIKSFVDATGTYTTDPLATIMYGRWNNFTTVATGNVYQDFFNGVLVASQTGKFGSSRLDEFVVFQENYGTPQTGYTSNPPGMTDTTVTPEPATFALMAPGFLGIFGVGGLIRRRRKNKA
jgi:hypothetical protein